MMKWKPEDLAELQEMKLGDFRSPDECGSLVEIHRVFGGWIYVFSMSNSLRTSSVFVPEEINLEAKIYSRHTGI